MKPFFSLNQGESDRISEVGRDLRQSLVQPPVQSRTSYGIGPAMGSDQLPQGFVQLQIENLRGQKLHRLDCLHEEKAFPYSLFLSEHLVSIYAYHLLCSHHIPISLITSS